MGKESKKIRKLKQELKEAMKRLDAAIAVDIQRLEDISIPYEENGDVDTMLDQFFVQSEKLRHAYASEFLQKMHEIRAQRGLE